MSRLTVVQLIPALHTGGVERSTVEISQALTAQGHRAIVIASGGRLVASLVACGAEHIDLPIGRKALTTLRMVWTLRQLFRRLRPDIVHARSRLPAWIGRSAIQLLPPEHRPHWLTTVHGLHASRCYSAVMVSGERVICVSETVRNYVKRCYPNTDTKRLCVIPRGIDPVYFSYRPHPDVHARAWVRQIISGWDGQCPLLIMPGRGTRLKGHHDALILLASLQEHGIKAFLWLVGVSDSARLGYRQELEVLAHQLNIAHAVTMSPVTSAMSEVYASCDLVLQLSRRPEAFGRTVLESLAVGRPVVGWDHGGVGEQLRSFYPQGAVKPFDHHVLRERVRQLLACPGDLRRPNSLTLQAMQASTLRVYQELSHSN